MKCWLAAFLLLASGTGNGRRENFNGGRENFNGGRENFNGGRENFNGGKGEPVHVEKQTRVGKVIWKEAENSGSGSSETGFGSGSETGFGSGSETGFGSGSETGSGSGSGTGSGSGSWTGSGSGSETGSGSDESSSEVDSGSGCISSCEYGSSEYREHEKHPNIAPHTEEGGNQRKDFELNLKVQFYTLAAHMDQDEESLQAELNQILRRLDSYWLKQLRDGGVEISVEYEISLLSRDETEFLQYKYNDDTVQLDIINEKLLELATKNNLQDVNVVMLLVPPSSANNQTYLYRGQSVHGLARMAYGRLDKVLQSATALVNTKKGDQKRRQTFLDKWIKCDEDKCETRITTGRPWDEESDADGFWDYKKAEYEIGTTKENEYLLRLYEAYYDKYIHGGHEDPIGILMHEFTHLLGSAECPELQYPALYNFNTTLSLYDVVMCGGGAAKQGPVALEHVRCRASSGDYVQVKACVDLVNKFFEAKNTNAVIS